MPFYSKDILAVYGEYEIPYESNNQVKRIRRSDKTDFLSYMKDEHPGILNKMGIYVFCIRASGGTLPWYVGKTSRSLSDEILDADKLVKYNDILHTRKRGIPCFYFLAPRSPKGKTISKPHLSSIEQSMIAIAYERNHELANINSTSRSWCIDGIMGGDGGKRKLTDEENNFCSIMGVKADRKYAINASTSE